MSKRQINKPDKTRCPHVCPPDEHNPNWLVPYKDGYAMFRHHHDEGEEDHSTCGPTVFCCRQSSLAFLERFPDSPEANADWMRTDANQIVSWIDAGVPVLYFIFCAPDAKEDTLMVTGLSGDYARQVLQKSRPLEEFARQALILESAGPKIDDISIVKSKGSEPRQDFDIGRWKSQVSATRPEES